MDPKLNEFDVLGYEIVRNCQVNMNFDLDYIQKSCVNFIDKSLNNSRLRSRNRRVVNGYLNSYHLLHECEELVDFFRSNTAVIAKAESLLDKACEIRAMELFQKSHKLQLEVPFHQDNGLWNLREGKGLTFWIPFVPISERNGGLEVFEATHLFGDLEHIPSDHPGTSRVLADDILEDLRKSSKLTALNLNRGDCSVHHCRTVHGSSKNTSGADRPVMTIQIKVIDEEYELDKKADYDNCLETLD